MAHRRFSQKTNKWFFFVCQFKSILINHSTFRIAGWLERKPRYVQSGLTFPSRTWVILEQLKVLSCISFEWDWLSWPFYAGHTFLNSFNNYAILETLSINRMIKLALLSRTWVILEQSKVLSCISFCMRLTFMAILCRSYFPQ